MIKVFFSEETSKYILNYFENYRKYFENLFEDSGIWSENKIIKSYLDESLNRHIELKNLIVKSLKEENIFGRKNSGSIFIRWRTKYIFIDFEEDFDLKQRFIINIIIK